MKKIKILVELDIDTNKTFEEIKTALIRGIYRGLDTEPHNIAPPANVHINNITEI